MLQVTPNGPWGTEVHPSMPISLPEVLAQVRSCLVAGADSVHEVVATRLEGLVKSYVGMPNFAELHKLIEKLLAEPASA